MISNQEWLNFNSNRRYPFKTGTDGHTLRIGLDNNVVVDCIVAGVPFADRVFLSTFTKSGTTVTFKFETDNSNKYVEVNVPLNSHERFQTYSGQSDDLFAVLVVDSVKPLMNPTNYSYSFGLSEFELEPRCIQYNTDETTVVSLADEDEGIALKGHVKLKAGLGLRLATDQANNSIEIHLDSLNDTPVDCDCPPNYPFIKTVNGVLPDCNGNLCLNADGINVIENDGNCLTIKSSFEPNQICVIETGIPGVAGPQGPQGATLNSSELESTVESLASEVSGIAGAIGGMSTAIENVEDCCNSVATVAADTSNTLTDVSTVVSGHAECISDCCDC